jgi:hypothetical protein
MLGCAGLGRLHLEWYTHLKSQKPNYTPKIILNPYSKHEFSFLFSITLN